MTMNFLGSLVFLLCLARSRLVVTRTCVLKCVNVSVLNRRKCVFDSQCEKLITQSFRNMSKSVEQESELKMSSVFLAGLPKVGLHAAALGMNRSENVWIGMPINDQKIVISIEGSEGIREVRDNGRTEPIIKEKTWFEDEETRVGLIFNLEGKHHWALTGK